jgi:hypothetical protein
LLFNACGSVDKKNELSYTFIHQIKQLKQKRRGMNMNMSIEKKIIALLSKKAINNFVDYQSLQNDYGEDSPESIESWVRRLVSEHQHQKPASWQNWQAEERAKVMAGIANQCITEGEFAVERAIDLYG